MRSIHAAKIIASSSIAIIAGLITSSLGITLATLGVILAYHQIYSQRSTQHNPRVSLIKGEVLHKIKAYENEGMIGAFRWAASFAHYGDCELLATKMFEALHSLPSSDLNDVATTAQEIVT